MVSWKAQHQSMSEQKQVNVESRTSCYEILFDCDLRLTVALSRAAGAPPAHLPSKKGCPQRNQFGQFGLDYSIVGTYAFFFYIKSAQNHPTP